MKTIFRLFGYLALVALLLIAGYQMFDYWTGVAVFGFVSTVFTAVVHIAILLVLVSFLIHYHKATKSP